MTFMEFKVQKEIISYLLQYNKDNDKNREYG